MESNDEALVLTPKEVRQKLKISRSVLYSALAQGRIPSIRISPRKIIIPKHAFMRWLDEGGGNDLHSQKGEEKARGFADSWPRQG